MQQDLGLKNHLMSMLSINQNKDSSSIFNIIYMFIAFTSIENLFKYMPVILEVLRKHIAKILSKKVDNMLINSIKPQVKSRIIYNRNYKNDKIDTVPDALLEYMAKLDSSEDLLYKHIYIVNSKKEFNIERDVYCKFISVEFNSENNLESIIFEIYSYGMELSMLKNWVGDILHIYEIEKSNKFGNKRFFFDEILNNSNPSNSFVPQSHKKYVNPDPDLYFTMTHFQTNKSLKNMYGSSISEIKKRIDLFVNHPEWYTNRGIPHTLGILLHGPPGTGKTSMIKSIAKDNDRHIINIKLRDNTSQKQLFNLFFSDKLKIKNGVKNEEVIIQQNQRIYVLEDIDCLTDITLDRDYKQADINENKIDFKEVKEEVKEEEEVEYNPGNYDDRGEYRLPFGRDFGTLDRKTGRYNANNREETDKNKEKDVEDDSINLSFILNLLDGVLETPGRIIIMTSNYPERLDKALIRPGRIDINVCLSYCDKNMVENMFNNFFENDENKRIELDSISDEKLKELKFTPAFIQSHLCNYYNNMQLCIETLNKYFYN
jgi:DNA polymerase III delta prime subunit